MKRKVPYIVFAFVIASIMFGSMAMSSVATTKETVYTAKGISQTAELYAVMGDIIQDIDLDEMEIEELKDYLQELIISCEDVIEADTDGALQTAVGKAKAALENDKITLDEMKQEIKALQEVLDSSSEAIRKMVEQYCDTAKAKSEEKGITKAEKEYYEITAGTMQLLLEKETITYSDFKAAKRLILQDKKALVYFIEKAQALMGDKTVFISQENRNKLNALVVSSEKIVKDDKMTGENIERLCNMIVDLMETIKEGQSEYKLGDANRDGKINMKDVMEIQKVVTYLKEFDEEQIFLADVTRDGKVSMRDILTIQRYIARFIDEF